MSIPFMPDRSFAFDVYEKRKWFVENWALAVPMAVTYFLSIHAGQTYMENRPAYSLKRPLVVWNLILASFSTIGSFHIVPELVDVLTKGRNGLWNSVCDLGDQNKGSTGYWNYVYILWKMPELVDTAFLVLRKRPVIFLHSYHHASVLCISWYHFQFDSPSLRWGISMNIVIHACMYTYYALRAAGARVPRAAAMSITVAQILQMLIGTLVCGFVFWQTVVLGRNDECPHNPTSAVAQLLMYISYLVLFAAFFRNAYFQKNAEQKSEGSKID